MAYITLAKSHPGTHVVGGVRFLDGKAESVLGPHTRRFFEAIGATVSDESPEAVPATSWTKDRLNTYAAEHGITVPDGTKGEILDAIRMGQVGK